MYNNTLKQPNQYVVMKHQCLIVNNHVKGRASIYKYTTILWKNISNQMKLHIFFITNIDPQEANEYTAKPALKGTSI